MKKLKRRYRKYINYDDPDRYIKCWHEDYLKSELKQENRMTYIR